MQGINEKGCVAKSGAESDKSAMKEKDRAMKAKAIRRAVIGITNGVNGAGSEGGIAWK